MLTQKGCWKVGDHNEKMGEVISEQPEKIHAEGPLKVTNPSSANQLINDANISIVCANVENVNYYNEQCNLLVQTDKTQQGISS